MSNLLHGKRILLGVTGSIACYKAADLASKLTQSGAQVDVILTEAATKFIAPLTFQSVSGRRAYTEADLWGSEGHVQHIGLGKNADLLVIAPASANTLAKLANGIADNLLTVTALATTCQLIVAPAMDGGMYAHPATQANLDTLRKRGARIIGPVEGHLASGMAGIGRMVEPADLLASIRLEMSKGGPLSGCHVVVTAGGTQEAIDPVRAITNRSSGKQGFALAQAALDLGAKVRLVAGVTGLLTPLGAQRVDVRSAEEMREAVFEAIGEADVLLMAAAVADFRPKDFAAEKIKKEAGVPRIDLERTPDILAEVARHKQQTGWPRITVGFAAESHNLIANAQLKLRAKKMDLIVANDISAQDAGFGVDNNRVTLLFAGGQTEALPLMSKDEVASLVMERVRGLISGQGSKLSEKIPEEE
jgi:phosphopantothenoylcysteine decarboxylase/phosphopantothenate--cysteine ligase